MKKGSYLRTQFEDGRLSLKYFIILLFLSISTLFAADIRDTFQTRSFKATKAIKKSQALYRSKKLIEAFDEIQTALKLDPESVQINYFAHVIALELGDIDFALTHCKKAYHLCIDYDQIMATNVSLRLAKIYFEINDINESTKWYSQAFLLNPKGENNTVILKKLTGHVP